MHDANFEIFEPQTFKAARKTPRVSEECMDGRSGFAPELLRKSVVRFGFFFE